MSVNGMSNKSTVALEQKFINELAKKYFEAKSNKNSGQMKKIKSDIFLQIYSENKGNIKTYLDLYCKRKLKNYTDNSFLDFLSGFLYEKNYLDKYDYTINPNFTAQFIKDFKYYILNTLRKENDIHILNNNITDDEGNETNILDTIPSDENIEESFAENERENEIRIKLISLCTCFFISKKGRSANKTRYEYYRIFTTNIIVCDIRYTNDCNIYNRQEVMQVIDGDYIRFMAFTDFTNPEDILTMKIKKYSDIFENGSNELLKFNNEAKVIIEYRFRNRLDSKRVSASAVSQQLDKFREDCEIIKKEASYEA